MFRVVVLIAITIEVTFAGPILNYGYIPNSPENINLLKSGNFKQNADELSGQFEGDIVLNYEQAKIISTKQRTGLIDKKYRWENNTIPYALTADFSSEQKAYVRLGLDRIEEVSCLKFVPKTNEKDFVDVSGDDTGCHSYPGRQGGAQPLNLQLDPIEQGCFRIGIIMHEFLHALGFFHMHSATERNDWVRIEWSHIEPGKEFNFDRYDANFITNFKVDYDVTSVMHYGAYAFSSDGYATVIPHNISLINTIGQRSYLTESDIKRLNAMYECNL